jgi:uncharacterized protein
VAETLPLFPLAAVLLPGASLPLHIFEPRYRQLTLDLMTEQVPGRCFGVLATRPHWETDIADPSAVAGVGCSALLRQVKRLPDGRFDIVCRGERRFKLLDIDSTSAPYLIGSVEWVPDSEPADTRLLDALSAATRAAHRGYCQAAWQQEDWSEPPSDADPAELSHLVAADCLLTGEDRQRLLEEPSAERRLRLVRRMLVREAGILRELHAVPMPMSGPGPLTGLN